MCWTPYYVISVWFWIDPKSANSIDRKITNFLFIFSVCHCIANPLVYGNYFVHSNTVPVTILYRSFRLCPYAKNITIRRGNDWETRFSIVSIIRFAERMMGHYKIDTDIEAILDF